MGFSTGSYSQTVYTITGDGLGGYWYASKDSSDKVYQIGYRNDTATVNSAAQLYGRNTFKQLIGAFIQNNLALPTADVKINVDNITDQNNLMSQFEDPALTDADLQLIANTYDLVEFLGKFGIFPLVRRYYLLGILTLPQLRDVLIYMGQTDKITRAKAENVTDYLLNNGDITQAQYNAFWTSWDNQVGI